MTAIENEKIEHLKNLLKERFLLEEQIRKIHENILFFDKELFMLDNISLTKRLLGLFNGKGKKVRERKVYCITFLTNARNALLELQDKYVDLLKKIVSIN